MYFQKNQLYLIEIQAQKRTLYLNAMQLQGFIIDCHKTTKLNRKGMNSPLQQGLFNYPFFVQPFFPHYMNSLIYPSWDHHFYATSMRFNQQFKFNPQPMKTESDQPSYQVKMTPNVILRKKEKVDLFNPNKLKQDGGSKVKASSKSIKFQKENRNVVSNLLRVFLKNILEVHSYDDFIDSVIQRNNLKITGEQFCFWLLSFKINFKNYIKPKEIMRIVNAKHSEQQQIIFRVLLRHFVDTLGVSHCLTSKRLDRVCSRRHIEGLKELLTIHEEQNQ